jgi:hypothetical protein
MRSKRLLAVRDIFRPNVRSKTFNHDLDVRSKTSNDENHTFISGRPRLETLNDDADACSKTLHDGESTTYYGRPRVEIVNDDADPRSKSFYERARSFMVGDRSKTSNDDADTERPRVTVVYEDNGPNRVPSHLQHLVRKWTPIHFDPNNAARLASPSEQFYPAIRRCLRGSRDIEALEIFKKYESSLPGDVRNSRLDKAILLFFSNGRRHEGMTAFEAVKSTDYRPSQQVYTRLLQADYPGLKDSALGIFRNIVEREDTPFNLDETAIGAFLEYIARNNTPPEWRMSFGSARPQGDASHISNLFESYRRRLMKERGVNPGPIAYRAMIRVAGTLDDLVTARRYFGTWRNEMLASDTGSPPDSGPYLALLHSESYHSARTIRRYLQVIELMAHDKVTLTTDVYNALIAHEIRRRNSANAFYLYHQMSSSTDEHVRPDQRTFSLILRAYRDQKKRQRVDASALSFAKLGNNNASSSLSGKAKEEDFDPHKLDIVEFVHDMIESSVSLSTDLLNGAISCLVASRQFGAAYCALQVMRILRIEPNAQTHEEVVENIAELHRRKLVPEEIAQPDPESGYSLSSSLERVGRLYELTNNVEEYWGFDDKDIRNRAERVKDRQRVRSRQRTEFRDFEYLEHLLKRCCAAGDEEEWVRQVDAAWDKMRRTKGWETREIALARQRVRSPSGLPEGVAVQVKVEWRANDDGDGGGKPGGEEIVQATNARPP